ncbi:MAG TPA: 16S rRNA (cytidine(1402)-2'-O)-methyltransferase [Syntrophomonadaceae bacterium]|nr:16S rRNA (cytidine(1402)-2'-O)-methyltransferase [Syntrophomonadaceae bacterium]
MGTLFVCGTPIGNLEDASIRLIKTLKSVDMIACEDTRQTMKLLNHFKIKNRLISYHQHSTRDREDHLLQELQQGKNIALVTDAGMPCISDPGQELVYRAREAGIHIEVIPGPTAFTAALAVSGIDSRAFVFEGFLPQRKSRRREELTRLSTEIRTIIIYEAPHRLLAFLEDAADIWGEQSPMVIARELTKIHQEIKMGSIKELYHYYQEKVPRGEICIIIPPRSQEEEEVSMDQIVEEASMLIEEGMDKKEAFKTKAHEYSVKKSDIYKHYIESKKC